MPYRSLADVRPLLGAAISALNNRHDHSLKDFEDMLVWRFREGDQWQTEAELLDYAPEQLVNILTDTIPESPLYRYQRLMGIEQRAGSQFIALHADSVPRLLEDQRWITLGKTEVSFELQGKVCLYSPYTESNLPILQAMEPGVQYLAYYDSSSGQIPPAVIYVTTGDGRWIGALHHTAGLSRKDKDGLGKAISIKKGMLNSAVSRMNRNSPQVGQDNEDRINHNLDILAQAGAVEISTV